MLRFCGVLVYILCDQKDFAVSEFVCALESSSTDALKGLYIRTKTYRWKQCSWRKWLHQVKTRTVRPSGSLGTAPVLCAPGPAVWARCQTPRPGPLGCRWYCFSFPFITFLGLYFGLRNFAEENVSDRRFYIRPIAVKKNSLKTSSRQTKLLFHDGY